MGDRDLVAWLVARSEPAPFGDKTKTRVDPAVRSGVRLASRGATSIADFDPAIVLPEIESAFVVAKHLEAKLADVLVYREGDHFRRHKDTPRSEVFVGTLVVALPVAHTGGALVLDDGHTRETVDWGERTEARTLRWVAVFGDVDHAVQPVTSGARVTLVYDLVASERARFDPTRTERFAIMRTAIGALANERAEKATPTVLVVPCTRQVVVPRGKQETIAVEQLPGVDREIADAIMEAGFTVAVREYLVANEPITPTPRFPSEVDEIARLVKASSDEDIGAIALGAVLLRERATLVWAIRKRAEAALIYEGLYSATGFFGNEYSEAFIYQLAAIEATLPHRPPPPRVATPKSKASVSPKPKPVRVVHKKFGHGTVVGSTELPTGTQFEIEFDVGGRKKLMKQFVVIISR